MRFSTKHLVDGSRYLVLVGLVVAATWQTGSAQQVVPGTTANLQPVLPVVPQQHPRRPQGDADNQRFAVERPAADAPIGSFLESIKGNDVAFEVVVGQGRLLTLRQPIAMEDDVAVVAVGDPTVVDFEVLPNPRLIRLIGRRPGVTDLSISTADGETYSFEIHVKYDLKLVQAQLRQTFPNALVHLGQMGTHVVIEGQARSPAEVTRILQALDSYLNVYHSMSLGGTGSARRTAPPAAPAGPAVSGPAAPSSPAPARATVRVGGPQIINLLRVPGIQQVMLQVRIAELDRTALREIGADMRADVGNSILGTQISNAVVDTMGLLGLGSTTTAFGIFRNGDFQIFLRALRSNAVLNILAEPNLVAMSGHEASFLAGGQFPVPVPQSGGGLSNAITVEFKDFGVQLDFVPYVQDDETIRLKVEPEVSSIDFALGTTLDEFRVPGVNARKVSTTVEMREGQTLAIAGLLQVTLDGQTDRIPGLGDLPILGPLFSNTTNKRTEKELLVLVTPHLIRPMHGEQKFPLPGEEVGDPTDWEFYFLNRIESRSGKYFRATQRWHHPQAFLDQMVLEKTHCCGEAGYSH